jgi:hypothetical protein
MNPTAQSIADTISNLLAPHLVNPENGSFWLWARSDRAIVSINPGNIKSIESVYSDKFAHHLSTILGGVRVERTNSRGVYFQVGYTPVPPPTLEPKPLDLAEQTSPLMLPIGITRNGPLWLNLFDLGSVLIGGSRRMGKTRFLHGWIQALVHGQAADLWLFDGKDGLEFERYSTQPNVRQIEDLTAAIAELHKMANDRAALFGPVRATSMIEYNERVPLPQRMRPIVLIVDEAALIPEEAQTGLARLIAWSGAHGIIPVLATQRTGVNQVPAMIKTNLSTRIAFRVPAQADSKVILDRVGAEQLPAVPGRLILLWDGRLLTAQAYQVELPGGPMITPRDIALACWIRDQHNGVISISRLMSGQEMGEWTARSMIDEWQTRGWLLGGGNGVARRLSPALLGLLPQGLKVPQGSQGSDVGITQPIKITSSVSVETEE